MELLKEVAPMYLEIERQFIHALNEEEYAELRKLLGKILNHINVSWLSLFSAMTEIVRRDNYYNDAVNFIVYKQVVYNNYANAWT